MTAIHFLKRIAFKIGKSVNNIYKLPAKSQKEYLAKFKEPKDDIDRSYYQYRCQMKLGGIVYKTVVNFGSLPFLIKYLCAPAGKIDCKETVDAIFLTEGILTNQLIPAKLKEEFKIIKGINVPGELMTVESKGYFKQIMKRHPLSWHFLFKVLLKLRMYCYIVANYKPKAIIVCGEYSFASSILTDFCNRNDVFHIDIMHGEKLYLMRDAFFRFNRCYIWDEYYENLFLSLRAAENQFCVEVPPSLVLGDGRLTNKTIDFTYYLGAESGEKLKSILKSLEKLTAKGYIVSIRPHPIYTKLDELNEASKNIIVEDNKTINIAESILQTRNVISLYSTVLNQAFHSNVDIVIDNITDVKAFNSLSDLGYIMLNYKHRLLSDYIN